MATALLANHKAGRWRDPLVLSGAMHDLTTRIRALLFEIERTDCRECRLDAWWDIAVLVIAEIVRMEMRQS